MSSLANQHSEHVPDELRHPAQSRGIRSWQVTGFPLSLAWERCRYAMTFALLLLIQIPLGADEPAAEEGAGDAATIVDDDDFGVDPAVELRAEEDEDAAVLFAQSQLSIEDFDRDVFGGAEREAERSRKLFEIILTLKLASFDWPCGMTDVQKQKVQLAGRGDIERSFARVGEHRRKFDSMGESEPDDGRWGRQMAEVRAAKAIIETDPFSNGSLFLKTLVHSLTPEQLPKYDVVRAILRVGGRVQTRSLGSTTLREIDLHRRRFSDAGMERLSGLQDVQVLNLESTRISDAGLVHLRGLLELEELDLGTTDVTDAGLRELQGLKKLRKLNLQNTPAGDATLLGLKGLTNLRDLGLFGTPVGDRGLEVLREFKDLECLNLGATAVSDTGLSNIHPQAAVRLRELNLQGTQITDQGMQTIAKFRNLEVLELRNTPVTDAGLDCLRTLTRLKELYLAGTEVTDSAAADLNQILTDVKIYK
jgi:hypothetical protein